MSTIIKEKHSGDENVRDFHDSDESTASDKLKCTMAYAGGGS